ncbi:MAG: hypothetical protein KJN98_07270, partial [Pontiella sp.]|nr:hypothetical protein [Pontiella sp.]
LASCGMFSHVSEGSESRDLELLVAIINDKKQSATAHFFSALTLFIIPYRSTDHFQLLAVVREPATGKRARIPLEHSVSHWQQVFLLPFSLSRPSASELERCTDILLQNLCLEIHRSGMVK